MADQTDREALLQLLERFGITPYTGQPMDGRSGEYLSDRPQVDPPQDNSIVLVAKVGGVTGYANFSAWFTFDDDGKFTGLDIGE